MFPGTTLALDGPVWSRTTYEEPPQPSPLPASGERELIARAVALGTLAPEGGEGWGEGGAGENSMIRRTIAHQRLVAVFVFGCLLLSYPMLALLDRKSVV